MSTKTVTAILTANVSGFTGAMSKASASAKDFGTKFSGYVGKNEKHLNDIAKGAGLIGVGIAAGIGVAVKKFADFDSAMSNVAATGADAKQNLKGLTDIALEMGAKTSFSAVEAASGLEEMLKAGVSAQDAMSGLKGTLDLAAAGELGVGEAAELAATAMNVFNLEGTQVGHVADVLAAGAGKAQGNVQDIGAALNQSAIGAESFGLSLEETVGGLSLFAKAGLTGSDAGTSFKTMLTRLYAATGPGADKLKELGISAYTATGELKPMTELSGELAAKIGTLTPELRAAAVATIFGSDAQRTANILIDEGSEGYAKAVAGVNEYGYASRQAAERLNNLKGDLEGLSGAFDTAMIKLGSGANGPLRTLVQGLTGAVNAFTGLSDSAKSGVLAVAGITSVALLAGAGLLKIVTAANAARTAMVALGVTARGLSLSAGAIGVAITVAAAAFVAFAGKQAQTKANVDSLTDALTRSNGAIDENVRGLRAKALEESGALVAAQKLGISIQDVTLASMGNAEAQARVNEKMAAYAEVSGGLSADLDRTQRGQNGVAEAARKVSEAVGGGNDELAAAVAEYQRVKAATDAATPAMTGTAGASVKVASAAEVAAAALKAQNAALAATTARAMAAANALLGMAGSEIAVEAAIDDATAAAKENGRTLDVNSEKGRANKTALLGIASASLSQRDAMQKAGASTKSVSAETARARGQFISVAQSMGMSSKEAKALADKYFKIPKDVKTKVTAPGAKGAKTEADAVTTAVNGIPKSKTSTIRVNRINTTTTIRINKGSGVTSGGPIAMPERAAGGMVYGPGTATSDSIPVMLSTGEFVMRAAAVRALGVSQLESLNALGGPQRAFATGGFVEREPSAARSIAPSTFTSGYGGSRFSATAAPAVDAGALRSAVREGMSGMAFHARLDGETVELKISKALGGFVGGFSSAHG